MTKEQFLIFKSDLKLSVEAIKTYKKFESGKKWYNLGYSSEEEHDKDERIAWTKSCELTGQRAVGEYNGSGAYSFRFHWAYYCAKHQFTKEERLAYYKDQMNKLTKENKIRYIYFSWSMTNEEQEKRCIRWTEDILKAYGEEDLICFD